MAFPLLLALLIWFPFITTQDAVLLDDICQHSYDYDFCVSALRSDPRSTGADLRGLALVSLDLVLENLTETRAAIDKLLKSAVDRDVKGILGQCRFLYGEKKAAKYILSALQSWKSKAYANMSSQADDVGDSASACGNLFDEWRIRSSPLGRRNDNLFQLTQITAVIGKMLTNK